MSTDKEVKIRLTSEDNLSPALAKTTQYLKDVEKGTDAANDRLIALGKEAKIAADKMVLWEQIGVSLNVVKMGMDALKGAADLAGKALDLFGKATDYVIQNTPALKLQQDNLTAGFNELVATFGNSIAETESFQNAVMELRAQMGLLKDSVQLSENQVAAGIKTFTEMGGKTLLLGNEVVEITRKAYIFADTIKEMAIYLGSLVNPLTATTYGFTVSTKALVAFTEAIGLTGVSEFISSLHPLDAVLGNIDKATGLVSDKWQKATEDANAFETGVKSLAQAMSGAKGQFQEWGDWLKRYTEKLKIAGEDNIRATRAINEAGAAANAKLFQETVTKTEADRKAAAEKARAAAEAENKRIIAEKEAYYARIKSLESEMRISASETETQAYEDSQKKAEDAYKWSIEKAKKLAEHDQAVADEESAINRKKMDDWGNYADAATTSMDAVLNGMEAFGASQQAMATAVMVATAAKAGIQAAYETAEALACFANPLTWAAGLAHTAAAVQYATVAAMTVSAGPQGGSSGGSAGGSVGSSGGSDGSQRVSSNRSEAAAVTYQINQYFHGSYTTEAEAGRKISDAIRQSQRSGTSSMTRSR